MSLLDLPGDIIIAIIQELSLPELSSLCITCKTLRSWVNSIGWTSYSRSNPRPSHSLHKSRQIWQPRLHVRYDALTAASWDSCSFVARPLSTAWMGPKQQPSLAISTSRLMVAAGPTLYSYKFGISTRGDTPSVKLEGQCCLSSTNGVQRDITSLAFMEDGGLGRTLICGFHDGTIAKVYLSTHPQTGILTPQILPLSEEGDLIESISSQRTSVLSLSAAGRVRLTDPSLFNPTSSCINLGRRSWSSFLSMNSPSPFVALGASSGTPLIVHSILQGGLSPSPTAILGVKRNNFTPSAVYGISRAPLSSPWGASPQIVVSGWFDGIVRCYDLRSSSRESRVGTPSTLAPVMSLHDPWSYDPIYSVSSGGGTASHVAAGSARHSVVSFWDIRSPRSGWSVYAPGNDRSPVYSIVLESSRLFGVTERRPFVYDFGPGVTSTTYPDISPEGLRRRKSNPVSFYVTKYSHSKGHTDEH
ncbi:hypothetical protein E1B28_012326 [Marasmius oreades]|uniref:F-box domain-containing protein n=1 Tax=Marasmius oreades TaxID=181124 RepID=A0A9P7RR83_9AGAR|nr:uncharacterized protein E1B28_012326 [Marasmius oreades]KAG7088316.1 hypothetical protein E1B28_012326 [Marasmius oreades]